MKTPKTIPEIIKEHAERIRCYHCGSDEEKIAHILEYYHDSSVSAMNTVKAFRDDLLTYLRAMALVVDMAGNASTHKEKNARLRGCVELIETAIGRLRESSIDFSLSGIAGGLTPDVFRSDYPTRHLLERIHELEDKLKVFPTTEIQPAAPSVDQNDVF